MEEKYLWADFISGMSYGVVVRINNKTELDKLKELAKQNKLWYYEYFIDKGYKSILNVLKYNANNESEFYHSTNGGKSFLVEYDCGKGFTIAKLTDYDNSRKDDSEWRIIPMSKIIEELKGDNK